VNAQRVPQKRVVPHVAVRAGARRVDEPVGVRRVEPALVVDVLHHVVEEHPHPVAVGALGGVRRGDERAQVHLGPRCRLSTRGRGRWGARVGVADVGRRGPVPVVGGVDVGSGPGRSPRRGVAALVGRGEPERRDAEVREVGELVGHAREVAARVLPARAACARRRRSRRSPASHPVGVAEAIGHREVHHGVAPVEGREVAAGAAHVEAPPHTSSTLFSDPAVDDELVEVPSGLDRVVGLARAVGDPASCRRPMNLYPHRAARPSSSGLDGRRPA
jgi:hypothetical protein